MLEEHNAEVVLLTCCRNTEDPPSWNSSEPFVARPPRSFCGIRGFSYSFTQDYVVSLLEKIFLLLSPPFREPEGQRNKHCCRERWGLQCRIHRIGNLRERENKRFYWFFFHFLILNLSQNVADLKQTRITCCSPQEGSYYGKNGCTEAVQGTHCSELLAQHLLSVKTFRPYRGAIPLLREDD